jgi:hypothetical protein
VKRWHVTGTVVGSKYLGEFKAPTKEKAIQMALESEAATVSLCHHCSDECEDPQITRGDGE